MADSRTRAQKASDAVTWFCGSWTFVLFFAVFTLIWLLLNLVAWVRHWDEYPFILLNLVFTVVELFQGPLIMMSQNRDQERDRIRDEETHRTTQAINTKLDGILSRL